MALYSTLAYSQATHHSAIGMECGPDGFQALFILTDEMVMLTRQKVVACGYVIPLLSAHAGKGYANRPLQKYNLTS
jgi:hypothetical protein